MQNILNFLQKAVISFFFLVLHHRLSAQHSFSLEKVEGEGLTNYYIKCISQDKNGYLWFGTEEGLFRYDGYTFIPVRNFPVGADSLPNSNIECLLAGDSGQIWVGSRGGLSCIDGRTMTIRNFNANKTFTVYSLLPSGDTGFIAGTSSGLYTFSKLKSAWHRLPGFEDNLKIRSLTAGKGDEIYAVSHRGLYQYNLRTAAMLHFDFPAPPGQPNTLQIGHRSMLDKKGILWISTWNAGLIRFDTSTGKMTSIFPDKLADTSLFHVALYDLLPEEDGKIFLANAENGVTIFDPSAAGSVSYPVPWDYTQQIKTRVYSLHRDRSGILWVGTENGIYKSDPHQATLNTLNFLHSPGGPIIRADLEALSILKDKDGCWWLGTYEGIYLLDPVTGLLTNYSAQAALPPHTRVTSLLEQDGDIWAAANHRLIRLRKSGSRTHPRLDATINQTPLIHSVITCLCMDHEKKLWLGTNGDGIVRFDPATGKFNAPKAPENGQYYNTEIRSIVETADSTLWVGGEHTGLLCLRSTDERLQKAEAFNRIAGNALTINAIGRDETGRMWIGTEAHGLWQTDQHLREYKNYTVADGLPSMNISAVLPAPGDHLWMITEEGVLDFHPLRKKMIVFTRQAGIRNPYSVFTMSRLDNGLVVIGDMGCIHTSEGADAVSNSSPPQLFITGFKVLNKDYPVDAAASPVLSYDQNYFSFEYVGLNYTHSSLNHYAYMLEGLDTRWNEAGTRRYASYANLKEGAYTFRVKACNNEGIWNNTPVSISFVIRPPFWRRTWFYVLIIFLIIAIAALLYLYKTNQVKSREALRNRIARDLHDDIGSTLSGINIFSRIALSKISTRPKESEELLQRIHKRSEKTMEALSDIVWSINTRGDHMISLVTRMQEYLGESLDPIGIQYEFQVDQSVRQLHTDMEIRRDIYLIFKESINNASKYSNCTLIRVRMKKEDSRIVNLEIEDNGIGFDTNSIVPGNGINNMQERAARIKAVCTVISSPGAGTRINLLFPIT